MTPQKYTSWPLINERGALKVPFHSQGKWKTENIRQNARDSRVRLTLKFSLSVNPIVPLPPLVYSANFLN
jgi:hypothetical protein